MHVRELPICARGATPAAPTCPVQSMKAWTTLLAAVAALLCAAAAAPAHGASRVIVRGAGFGHGVGMSQYGAYGFARRGRDHAFILAHYYSGTQIGQLTGPAETRVLLRNAGRALFRGVTGVAGGRSLDPAQTYVATRALGGAVQLSSAGGRALGTYKVPLRVTGAPGGVLLRGQAANGVTDGRYRGSLELRPGPLGLSAINAVSLEDYLKGVVPGEVPTSWPAAALRAQAVAARTYAIATRGRGVQDRRQLPALRQGLRRRGDVRAGLGHRSGAAAPPSPRVPAGHKMQDLMRMRQSLAEIESAFADEIEEDRERRERLGRRAQMRTHRRHVEKNNRRGTLRFFMLVMVLIATAVVVTIAMFQTLYYVMG